MTALVNGVLVTQKVRERFPNYRPDVRRRTVVGTISLGSNRVRCETCCCWSDNSTQICIRAIQGHCSRPIVNPEFFKNMIEMPHGRTNVTCHSSFQQQSLDNNLLNGVIAGGKGGEEGRHACYLSAARPQKLEITDRSLRSSRVAYGHD